MLTKEQFHEKIKAGVRFLDGATGSNLQKAGMPRGCCTEKWILEHPQALIDLQRRYAEAGSQIIGRFRLRRQRGEDAGPQAAMAPAIEAVVDRGRRAVFGRAILPAAPGAQHMDDTADDTPVIHPPRPRLVAPCPASSGYAAL